MKVIIPLMCFLILFGIYLIYAKDNSKWPFNSTNKDSNVTKFDMPYTDWEFLILQPSSNNISIGFVPPSQDGTFDRNAEDDMLGNKLRINYIRDYNENKGVFALTNVIIDSNPIPGNIPCFNLYTYNKVNKDVKHFIIARSVKGLPVHSPTPAFNVEPIYIVSDTELNVQQIQGNFDSNIPSKIIF